MATYTTRTIKTERHEFVVPTYSGGACWAEVMKAIRAAHQELWDLGLVREGRDASDDEIRLLPGDEDVVVFFVVERDGESLRLV